MLGKTVEVGAIRFPAALDMAKGDLSEKICGARKDCPVLTRLV